MSGFEPLPGGGSDDTDHEHDILLIAGSRPEVARLAPVAAAVAAADRIRGITVATGPDPMAVHEAFEALGVPTDITVLLPSDVASGVADVAAALLVRLDRLMVDQDPSAVLVHGGGMAAAVAATVAFWRRIPIVHMQAGMGTDDLLCPFPQEAHRRVIGQLASLFLTTSGSALGSPLGPNVLTIGDTVNSLPAPSDQGCVDVLERVRDAQRRLVLVDLERSSSLPVLGALADLLERYPRVEFVVTGAQATADPVPVLGRHPRVTVVPELALPDELAVMAAATVLISDDHELVADAPGLGTLAVLVDGPNVPQPGDSIRSIAAHDAVPAVAQVMDGDHGRRPAPSDGLEAARAEQAVAWMFGLCRSPQLPDGTGGGRHSADGSATEEESSEA
ncbi:UDP-N-acetylglucosamine 2-epimerase [Pseudonocardia sp. Ae168_Ps1]|uniref:UDP-N-acetylglucosamine 2-epimerase n=1 Tax=unclassified Pseudonocardia TaxID=2619320 RepID=UPI00094AD129|nr:MULTISPECIES: UDP-N-acetylglucosamine 2-epimerase [unclassified Pseudonocardia]OLL74903.1 UDP-N-acetylglucosamine 2-epimerase [Pseudonocardia sp. Ae150A_Ps1]OLL80895.1 UDP-N-acetylglucosamine 2-epimerase [Pseudonocardia sp. Ae168_Ps1]OLL84987.1 UDP-N-acetylglucosamine 2-epimerase [Pseudonocardia sp. Ae263_Ps1]OLL94996.1 UDP-N-acetylglucosamine 2-epimerase [Pseudonocardia sp. Ae356_Ps1]